MRNKVSDTNQIPLLVLDLPKTGHKVSISSYLTTGQSRELQVLMFGEGSFDTATERFTGLTGQSFLAYQDKAAEFLIKEVKNSEGVVIPYTKEWHHNLPAEDGNLIYSKVTEIATSSLGLPVERKKK